MSSQAGRTFFKVTEVTLEELPELGHVNHFAMGKPSIQGKCSVNSFGYVSVGIQNSLEN